MRKLDICCGPNKTPGFIGIDQTPFPGVDIQRDVLRGLPFDDNSVDEIVCKHAMEHFQGMDLIFLVEDCWRVSKPGIEWTIIVPDATSPNRYRDPTHCTRDWHADSFMLWQVDEQGKHLIFVGPSYGRRAKLKVLATSINGNKDRSFEIRVIK